MSSFSWGKKHEKEERKRAEAEKQDFEERVRPAFLAFQREVGWIAQGQLRMTERSIEAGIGWRPMTDAEKAAYDTKFNHMPSDVIQT